MTEETLNGLSANACESSANSQRETLSRRKALRKEGKYINRRLEEGRHMEHAS